MHNRSNYQTCSSKKSVLRYFTKFTGKQLCQRCSVKKVFLETLQYSQENTCARAPLDDCPIQFNTEEHHICIWLSFIAQISNLSSRLEVFSKKNVLNFFTKIAWKHLQWSHYFNKVGNATLLKKNFSSGALLWILRVFWEQLLCRKPVNGCLYQIDYFFLPF